MARYLVTGGAGFIGSNIIEELVRRDEKVRVLDNFITGKRENLEPFKNKIELIEGDIRDKEITRTALNGVDFVLHQAALRSVTKSVEDPVLSNEINVTGTLNLLVGARTAGVKRFVYASSSSVYGDSKKFPQKESDPVFPVSPYGASKLAGENYCISFARTFGLETVCLRYFNVFGPRMNMEGRYSLVIPAFIFKMLRKESPTIDWDGKQTRDFIYVKNVVEANLRACTIPGASGEVFNVACGATTSIIAIFNGINKLLKTDLRPEYAPRRAGDARKTYADVSKMKNVLGIKKIVDFEEGLKLTIDWFRKR